MGLLFLFMPGASGQEAAKLGAAPGRLLVRFRDGVTPDQAKSVLRSLQAESTKEIPGIGVHVVQLPPAASEAAYQNVLRGRPDVEFAEPDYLRRHEQTQVVPNDPSYGNQWHLPKIGAPAAWGTTKGSASIVIAIVDSGVDGTHPDLSAKMVSGWNVVDNNSNTADVYGHGTQVAGTAAAATNNGLGVASVAWNCWIMPVRISQTNGSAYDSAIASGITWAADHGARVANVSYNVSDSSTISAAARYMNTKGGVVTVSAGNYSTFHSIANDPYMITVAATDPNDLKYSWSDYGNDLDLAAPGCLLTTARGGGYANVCGTSFSAPVVAGVAALVISANPSLSASQVLGILQTSADDLGAPGWDTTYGRGRVNAGKAVVGAGGVTADTQAPVISFVTPGAGATVSGAVIVQVSATDNVGVTSTTVTANGAAVGNASTFSWNTSMWANGSYVLVATARDAAGNTSTASRSVIVSNATDTIAPTVTLTAPASGATLSGNPSLTASAQDNVGVVKVEYFCDGALIGTATTAPFSYKWNVRKVTPGSHTIQARAYDAAGNVGVSAAVSITTTR
jgi:thermitase